MWAPELAAPGETLRLDAESAHHVTRVCRARPGDRVTLTDGRGGIASAVLTDTGRICAVRVRTRDRRPMPAARILLLGAPEGERADWLVEKAVELGVTAIWPVDTERAAWRRAAARRDRWERLARAALGQSRRAWSAELAAAAPLATALGRLPAGARCWLADGEGEPAGGIRPDPAEPHVALVGPSPGLTDAERASAIGQGFLPISLSDCRLRSETAAIAMAAWWAALAPQRSAEAF